jgi:hypothetical protein
MDRLELDQLNRYERACSEKNQRINELGEEVVRLRQENAQLRARTVLSPIPFEEAVRAATKAGAKLQYCTEWAAEKIIRAAFETIGFTGKN